MPPSRPRLTLSHTRTRPLAMRGASAVAAGDGALYLVEDDEGIYRMSGRTCRLWAEVSHHPTLGDLEGIAADEAGRHLWALSEESGEVVSISTGEHPRVKAFGRLHRPGRRENKGFEGLAFAPARVSPNGRASLVAVHEAKPRRVGIFALPDLKQTHNLKLPADAKRALSDLADVTVDPITGLLLLLSEESRRLGIVSIDGDRLVLHDLVDIEVEDDARPEGVDFVTPTRLVVVTEGPATMIEYKVRRSAERD